MNTNQFASTVIPRFIEEENTTAFFFAEEEPVNGTVKAYVEGKGVQEMTIEQYRRAGQLHPEDVKVALEIYRRCSGLDDVHARSRMPYKKDPSVSAPRRLAHVDIETGEVEVEQALAEQQTNPEVKAVVQALADKTKAKRKYEKKSAFWSPDVPKGRARTGKAKTIEAQATSQTSESKPVKSRRSEAAALQYARDLEAAAQKQAAEEQAVQAQSGDEKVFSEAEVRAVTERAVQAAIAELMKAA